MTRSTFFRSAGAAALTLALLSGCSTVRGVFGGAQKAGDAAEKGIAVGPPPADGAAVAATDTPAAAPVKAAAAPSVGEDMRRAADRLPRGLAGDTANSAHTLPIPPQ
jgi:predicted small secreted protein